MAHKIQIKRGNKADIPVLNDGEMGLCIDTQEVFIGCNGTNIPVNDLDAKTIKSDVIITVGSGGDFLTINAALESLNTSYPQYKQNGISVEIKLLSGFIMQEQVLVKDIDLGWITITSVDPVVIIDKTKLTTIAVGSTTATPAFGVFNGALPTIGTLFDMQATEFLSGLVGIFVCYNSRAIILPQCGVKNTGSAGLYAYKCSKVEASGSIFTGAKENGVHAQHGCLINIPDADVSGALGSGVNAQRATHINAESVNASGCGGYGIYANTGSTIFAGNANAKKGVESSTTDIRVASGAMIVINANTIGGTYQEVNTLLGSGIILK